VMSAFFLSYFPFSLLTSNFSLLTFKSDTCKPHSRR
jgi:hypothetical protein